MRTFVGVAGLLASGMAAKELWGYPGFWVVIGFGLFVAATLTKGD